MSSLSVIRVSKTDVSQIQWIHGTSGHAPAETPQTGIWEQLPKSLNNQEVILLVPGADITLHTLSMPNINRRKLSQAIPFALEDKLAGNIEDLHFAFTRINNSDKVAVAVINDALVQSWLKMLQSHNLTAKFILPESLLLPAHDDGWTIMIDGGMAYLRTNAFQSATIDIGSLSATVQLMLDNTTPSHDQIQNTAPQTIHVYTPAEMTCNDLLKDLNCDIQNHTVTQAVISLLAQNITQAIPLNLLQGKYQAIHKRSNTMRYTAICLGLALTFTLFTTKILENNQLQQQSNTLGQNIKQYYQKIFPNAATVPGSAQRQIQQKLDELSRNIVNRPFLPLLTSVGEAINQSPGIRLNSLSFSKNTLTVNVESNSANIVDMMTRKLQSRDLSIISNTVSTDGSIATAVLVITSGSLR